MYIYKKTDSGLRGNIGKELEAALAAGGEEYLTFIPALPAMNRITVKANSIRRLTTGSILKSGRFIWNRTRIGDVRLSIVMRKNSPVIHFLLLHLIY